MGLKLAILDSAGKPILGYPVETFLLDLVERLPSNLNPKTLMDAALVLIKEFKEQTKYLPPEVV